jgi:tetratricopeptide (TPR) repeat protein
MVSRALVLCLSVFIFLLSGCTSSEESARTLYNQALTLQKNGQQKESLEIYKRIAEKYPSTQTAVEVNKMLLVAESIQIESIRQLFKTALDYYRLDNGRYPTMEEGLKPLFSNTLGLSTWNGPYIQNKKYEEYIDRFTYTTSGTECELVPR